MRPVAFLDGQPIQAPDTSAGRLLGLTCFETIAVEAGQLAHLEAHLERLAGSLSVLGLEPEGGLAAIEAQLARAVSAFEGEQGICRVSVHATGQPTGLQLEDAGCSVQIVVSQPRYGDVSQGVAAITSTRRAPDPASWSAEVKAPNLARFLAHREARSRGAFEALMLDARGHVVSGSRSNLLAVLEGVLVTPPAPPALPGITRGRVLDHLEATEQPIEVRGLHRDVLGEASELILAFTGPGIVPVVELDGAPVGDGYPGPVAQGLACALG